MITKKKLKEAFRKELKMKNNECEILRGTLLKMIDSKPNYRFPYDVCALLGGSWYYDDKEKIN